MCGWEGPPLPYNVHHGASSLWTQTAALQGADSKLNKLLGRRNWCEVTEVTAAGTQPRTAGMLEFTIRAEDPAAMESPPATFTVPVPTYVPPMTSAGTIFLPTRISINILPGTWRGVQLISSGRHISTQLFFWVSLASHHGSYNENKWGRESCMRG